MQIQLSSRDLSRAMSAASKVINSKNSMPILDYVLLSEQDGKYFLTGSDNETELSVALPLTILQGQFTPLCLDTKNLLPVLGRLGDQPLTITFTEFSNNTSSGFTTNVKYLNGSFNITSLHADEFPRIRENSDRLADFSVKASYLVNAVTAAQKCTANDELRPQMNGVLLDLTNSDPQHNPMPEQLNIVASDGKKLYKYVIPTGTDANLASSLSSLSSLLLSKKAITALRTAVSSDDITLHIIQDAVSTDGNLSPRNVIITTDTMRLVSRSLEGRYPNYNSVIPMQHNYDITMPVKDLLASVNRVSLFASDASKMVALRVEGLMTTLTAEDIDYSTSSKELLTVIDSNLPADFAIGMNFLTLAEHLSCVTTDNARLELSDPSRPVIIKEDNPNSTLTLLLMPMLLNV